MANFKVGDEIVCLSAVGNGYVTPKYLKAGMTYSVSEATECCGRALVGLVGINSPRGGSQCPFCLGITTSTLFCAWRFIKLDGLTEHHEEKETANA